MRPVIWRKHQKVAPSAQVPASVTAHNSQLVARVPTTEFSCGSQVKPMETYRTNTCHLHIHVCDSFIASSLHGSTKVEHIVVTESLGGFSLPAFQSQLHQAPALQPVCASITYPSMRNGGQSVVSCSAMLLGMEGIACCIRGLRMRYQRVTLSKSVEQG